jgi:protoporphyrinogen oxidase
MRIVIIGAGIGGLASAYWLGKQGYDVEIMESGNRPGGRMVTFEHRGDLVDVGAQFYHTNFRYSFELIDEMKLSAARRGVTGNIRYRLEDGSVHEYGKNAIYMDLLGIRGNLKLYWSVIRHIIFGKRFTPYHIEEPVPDSDRIGVLDHFNQDEDQQLRDFLIFPLSVGATQGPPEYMSLYHFIRSLHTFTIAKHVCLTGGVASLTDELAKRVRVRYDSPVRQLVMERGKIVGVQMEDGSVQRADHVIVAVDAASAARLMPEELEDERRFFEGVIYSPSPMPVFFLDRPLPGNVWNYWSDPRLKRTFLFAIDGRVKIPEMCPSGKSVLTAWSIYPKTVDLMHQSDDLLIRQAQDDVDLMIPGFSQWIEEARVIRLPFATEQYPAGAYRRVMDFKARSQSFKGVSFVSSLLGGTNMESSLGSAAAAVRRVCRALET